MLLKLRSTNESEPSMFGFVILISCYDTLLRRLLSSLDQSTALTKPINGKSQPQMQPSADADRLRKQRVGDDDTELKLPATSPVSSSSHPLGKSRDSSTPLANFASPTVWLSLCKRNRYRILY